MLEKKKKRYVQFIKYDDQGKFDRYRADKRDVSYKYLRTPDSDELMAGFYSISYLYRDQTIGQPVSDVDRGFKFFRSVVKWTR